MRILILTNSDSGLYQFRKELIEELLRQNNEVFIASPGAEYIPAFEQLCCTFINTPVDRRGVNPLTDLGLFLRYRKLMREITPDLVITYTIKPNIYGGLAARLAGKSYAANITGLGTAFQRPGVIRSLVIILYKIALKKAKVVFFENSGNRDVMLSYGCCEESKTVVLNGAGVNLEKFAYQPYPQNDIFRFLFIGRVMREKGVEELLQAMRRLNDESVNCSLDILGGYEENYKDIIEAAEKAGWLHYHGVQSDVRPFIANCDCFVLPSWHEGMANTNLECAASGRPIITSNIPGCKEAVIDSESGYLCESKDANSLYEAMKRMIHTSYEERVQMGLVGRKHMEDVFDKKKVVENTVREIKR